MLSWRHETNKLTNEEMFNIRSYAYGATSTSSNSICVLYYGGYDDTLDGDNLYSDSVTMFAKAAAATFSAGAAVEREGAQVVTLNTMPVASL